MGVLGGGCLAVPQQHTLLSRAVSAPQLGLGAEERCQAGTHCSAPSQILPPPAPHLSLPLANPPVPLCLSFPSLLPPSLGVPVGPTLRADVLRPGNSGTLTPLLDGDARTRRLLGSSAASSSEDTAGWAGRGSASRGTASP